VVSYLVAYGKGETFPDFLKKDIYKCKYYIIFPDKITAPIQPDLGMIEKADEKGDPFSSAFLREPLF